MKLAIIGYGKMGKTIEKVADERGHKICLKMTRNNREQQLPKLKEADAAVEFTDPDSTYEKILTCFDINVTVVSGTTGWTDQLPEIKEKCNNENKAFFYASNFSIGMNLVFALNRKLAQWMDAHSQYEVAVSETHHTEKKDAPSGTAETIADDITDILKRKKSWENKISQDDQERYPASEDEKTQLKVTSYRKPEVPGIHQIIYDSPYDQIEIKHTAHSRKGFALGAVIAAEWLQDKTGYYGMEDLLNLT
jgi:4-hydroxy-tetrahydrodipicolinate reductase